MKKILSKDLSNEFEKKDGEFLDMGKMAEGMPIELANKGDYLFMNWVDKYITKIEDQGCTRIFAPSVEGCWTCML